MARTRTHGGRKTRRTRRRAQGGSFTKQSNTCGGLEGAMKAACVRRMATEGLDDATRVTEFRDSDMDALAAAAARRAAGQVAGRSFTKQANTCGGLEGAMKAACIKRMATEGLDDATRVTEFRDSDMDALKAAAARRAAGQVAGRGRKRRKSSKKSKRRKRKSRTRKSRRGRK